MERHTMFMVLKIQYCKGNNSPQTSLQIPCNLNENHGSFCLFTLWKLGTDNLILRFMWKCKGPITDLLHWILKLITEQQ